MDLWSDEPVPCGNPECAERGGMADPESDGELRYYACTRCGYEFGYEQASRPEGACQLGVPEEVRRSLSIAGRSIDIPVPELTEEGRKVFLGAIGRRPG